jgi:NADH dehydrogenase FAD-containing subunit
VTGAAVVVGGGFAALEIALELRNQHPPVPVTVISTEKELTYRPWLIRVPAGSAPPPSIHFARLLNAAGVEVILRMRRQMLALQANMAEMETRLNGNARRRSARLASWRSAELDALWEELMDR